MKKEKEIALPLRTITRILKLKRDTELQSTEIARIVEISRPTVRTILNNYELKRDNNNTKEIFEELSGERLEEKFFSLLDLYDKNTPMTWNGINRDVLMMFLKKEISEIAYKKHDIAQERWNDLEYRENYMQKLLTSLFKQIL